MSQEIRDQLQAALSGSYTLERELGGGGMSQVFVAEEHRLKRKVVVKVLSPELTQGISVERFEREIQTAAALQQANIVPVLSAGDSNGLPFYTMPFVEGESLRARLARGPLAVTEAIGVLRDVSKALAYAHQRGVVHRDIKPDNVLLSGGTAVVTDFGIAKAISAARNQPSGATLTQIGTSIGTPAYMAPEQAAGDPEIDHRADIYSLGAMAYELLSGQAVFSSRTPQRMLAAHMGEAPKPITDFRPDLPTALAELVMGCKRLLKTIALDSTFALAHLEYSLVRGWGDASLGTRGGLDQRTHALLAQRFGANLPKRERMLIDSRVASANDDNSRACEIAKALVAQDSTDVESLYLLGECSYHDTTVDPSPSDPRIGTFRGSWNTAIRSFTRILELDPGFFAAFEPFQDILGTSQRTLRCTRPGTAPDQCVRWNSFVVRAGDTLQTVPVREGFDSLFGAQAIKAANDHVRLINLGLAKSFAKRWFDSDTTSEQARGALARASLAIGDLETAYAQLVRLPVRGTQDNFQVLRTRVEVAAKLGHGAEARAMFDSLVKAVPDVPGIDVQRGSIELMFGRLTRFDRGMAAAGARLGPEAVAYQKQVGRALLGLPSEDMARDEAAFFASMKDAGCVGECRLMRLQPTLAYALHVPVGGLAADSVLPGNNFRFAPARSLLAKDTAKLRAWARSYEVNSRDDVASANQDFGFALLAADLYLVVHDSVSALRAVRFFVDSAMTFQSVGASGVGGLTNVMGSAFWPRAMLLRADLAAAAGQRDEATKWYGRVLDLWADADADFGPTIARIRSALASLPPGHADSPRSHRVP